MTGFDRYRRSEARRKFFATLAAAAD